MKKILLLTVCSLGIANAYTTINLNTSSYSCNGIKITSDTTESVVQGNCKNYKVKYTQDIVGGDDGASSHNLQPITPVVEPLTDDDVNNLARVRFITDQGQKMECFYKNNKLYKCKISNKTKPIASSAESK
jgi:fructose-specific phosphotransferase system component IIB